MVESARKRARRLSRKAERKVRREIAITQPEPVGPAVPLHHREPRERLLCETPAALFVRQESSKGNTTPITGRNTGSRRLNITLHSDGEVGAISGGRKRIRGRPGPSSAMSLYWPAPSIGRVVSSRSAPAAMRREPPCGPSR